MRCHVPIYDWWLSWQQLESRNDILQFNCYIETWFITSSLWICHYEYPYIYRINYVWIFWILNLESCIKQLTKPMLIYRILITRSEDTKQDQIVLPILFFLSHINSLSDSWKEKNIRYFLAATKQLNEWYFLSACTSVRPSVRLSHLFDYVPIIVSSWNFH